MICKFHLKIKGKINLYITFSSFQLSFETNLKLLILKLNQRIIRIIRIIQTQSNFALSVLKLNYT